MTWRHTGFVRQKPIRGSGVNKTLKPSVWLPPRNSEKSPKQSWTPFIPMAMVRVYGRKLTISRLYVSSYSGRWTATKGRDGLMGKASRDKGKAGEREFAALLRKHGYNARRGRQYKGTDDSPDVISDIPAMFEVKRRNQGSIKRWFEDFREGRDRDVNWIVAARADKEDWRVYMSAESWLKLMRWAYEQGEQHGLERNIVAQFHEPSDW